MAVTVIDGGLSLCSRTYRVRAKAHIDSRDEEGAMFLDTAF